MDFGSNIFQPFFIGITNFIQIIPNSIELILRNRYVELSLTKIMISAILMVQLLKLIMKKEYLKTFIIAIMISFSFTRTNEPFHEIPAWSLMLVAILMLLDKKDLQKNGYKFGLILSIILILSGFLQMGTQTIFQEQEPISELEKIVVDNTSDGEEIFYDIFSEFSVYLIYKDRLPINRLGFILPWYMDWYEIDTIQDLENKKPRIALYTEKLVIWKNSGFRDYLEKYLHENYEQLENNKVWKLK